jgi:hypothetical protein
MATAQHPLAFVMTGAATPASSARNGQLTGYEQVVDSTGKPIGWVWKPSASTYVWGALSTVSMAVSAYHGYKRNESVGWAIWWGLMGSIFPVITPVIAVAEGYAEPERGLHGGA